jgi:hypothetical protein
VDVRVSAGHPWKVSGELIVGLKEEQDRVTGINLLAQIVEGEPLAGLH